MFGEDFSGYSEDSAEAATAEPQVPTPTPAKSLESTDPSKGKKGKLNAKSTGLTYQFQILEMIGVPRSEIKKFADPLYWLEFFPPIAKEDLSGLGARVDWRRQFLTSTQIDRCQSQDKQADWCSRRQPILRLFRPMADEQAAPTGKDQVR